MKRQSILKAFTIVLTIMAAAIALTASFDAGAQTREKVLLQGFVAPDLHEQVVVVHSRLIVFGKKSL